MAFGGLTLVVNILLTLVTLVRSAPWAVFQSGAGAEVWLTWATVNGPTLFIGLLSMALSPLVMFAGARLRSAQSAGLVYVGAFLAGCPCCVGGCCCLGLPIAGWVIFAMQDQRVKAAFAEL